MVPIRAENWDIYWVGKKVWKWVVPSVDLMVEHLVGLKEAQLVDHWVAN